MTDDLLARLLDKVEHRYFGKYRASVVDNADPENRGRLRLQVPGVLGKDVVSGWALPCAPYGGANGQGFFFIPDKGAGVWAEFEGGLLEYPIWVGTYWSKPGGTTEVPPPADSQSPPTSKMIKTAKHIIELADEDGKEAIKITDDTNSNTVTLSSSGVVVQDGNGNKVALEAQGVTITSSKIKVGENATAEKLVLGTTLGNLLNAFQTALIAHTHVGNLGAPTTPPTPPLTPQAWATALSQKHFVE